MATKGTKSRKIEAAQVEEVRTAVKHLKPADILSAIANTQVSVQKTLADISSQVNEQMSLLDNVRNAVSIEESRLKELHDIDSAAISFDDYLAQIETKKQEMAKLEQERATKWSEEASLRQKQWQREAAEHEYAIETAHRHEEDQWKDNIAHRMREEQVRQETLNRGWAERESALKVQEKELADLRAQVANFPADLKKATEREVAIATNSVKRDYLQQLEIEKLNAQNAERIAASTIANATQTNQQLQAQIDSLRVDLTHANARAESIAAKAVEASSGRMALEAVQRSQETQAQSNSKSR